VYATTSDLEARWRPLTDPEAATATVLLADASTQIRSEFPTLDILIAGDADADPVVPPNPDLARNATRVVCAMVRRAMDAPEDGGFGVGSIQETTGPFSRSLSYSNPMGDLYLTKAERKLLGVGGGSGRLVAGSIDTAPAYVSVWDFLP
jgi:hypothetical protein